MNIKLKVCGMRDQQNIAELIKLKPDFIGHIFYEKSPRLIHEDYFGKIPNSIKRIGVFVNESEVKILEIAKAYKLEFIQLHGNETVEFAKGLKAKGIKIIKVLSVQSEMPMEQIKSFEPCVDYFLFDTKTPDFGGSGKKFDWSILKQYNSTVPFFLSGGIDLDDIQVIKKMNIERLFAIDVNSRFEVSLGLKDIKKLEALKSRL